MKFFERNEGELRQIFMTHTLINLTLSLMGGGVTYLALQHFASRSDRSGAKTRK